ncbi:MAG: glycosyltransferase [Sphingomonadaceae bacterium]
MNMAVTSVSAGPRTIDPADDTAVPTADAVRPPASAHPPRPVLIASIMRPTGETGVRAHMRAVLSAVAVGRRDDADAWPSVSVVSPFAAPWRIGVLLGARALIEPFFPSLAVRWYRTGHGWLLRSVLAKRLADGAPCTLYAQCPVSAAAALTARASPLQKVVMAVHFNVSQADEWAQSGRIPDHGQDFYAIRAFEARWLPQVDALVFVSRFMRGVLLERLPMLASVPHAIVPNFVADPGEPTLVGAIGAVGAGPDEAFDADLVSIGTLEPRKNQAAQLEIIAAAHRVGSPLTLTIVGDGPDRAMLETRANALGIADAVRFAGYVADAARLLARHRALLHTAHIENLPIVPIEALAAGRPVLAVPTGGTSELFDDSIEGLALPADDPALAAERIIELLADPARVAAMGRAARARHAARHAPGRVARELIDFLEQA